MDEIHRKSSLIAEAKRRKVVVIQDLLLLLNGAVRRNPHGVAVVSLHQPHLGLPGIATEKKPDQFRWTHSQSVTAAKVLTSCLREI